MSPLSPNDLALLREIATTARKMVDYWQRCTNCGMDVKPLAEQAQAQLDYAEKVLAQFGGG